MGGSGPICLLSSSHLGQSGGKVTGPTVQENHSDCSRVAQHALVLGSGDHVQPDPTVLDQPAHATIQSDSTQESVKLNLYVWLLNPQQSRSRASLRQWKHELRLLKGNRPDRYIRQSGPFLQTCASVIRWTSGHPVQSIADFLLYLFQDRPLCPVRALRYYLDRTSSRTRSWSLSPLRKVLTSHLPLSSHG